MHNVLDACISITRVSGRGLGPGILEFFGPCEMALSRKASAIWGPKNSRIPGPNPLALPQVMNMHASKTFCTGLYKSYVHRLLYAHEPPGGFKRVYPLILPLHPSYSPSQPLLFSPSNSAPSLLPHWLPALPNPPIQNLLEINSKLQRA